MRLSIHQPSPNVVVVSAEVNGQAETTVIDTATGTRPEALRDYVSDRGGTRPVDAQPRGPGNVAPL
jgi:hypothetical protein